jgi:hypothetical protein
MLEKLIPIDVGFNRALFSEIAGKPAMYSWSPPSPHHVDPEWRFIIERMENQLMNNPYYYGFAHEFFYQGEGLVSSRTRTLERVFLADSREPDLTLTPNDLELLTQDFKFTETFQHAKENGQLILIKHPVPITMVEGRGRITEEPPIDPQIREGAYKVRPIKIYFAFDDEFIDERSHEMAFSELPRFGVRGHNIISEDITYIDDLITSVNVIRDGFTIIRDFEVRLIEQFE